VRDGAWLRPRRRCSILSYGQPFSVRFRPGGRGERHEPHQGLVDDGGATKFACVGHRRTGSRAHTGKVTAGHDIALQAAEQCLVSPVWEGEGE
jgi:hypothetical protein